ncbi:hypothetical protein GJAV_G00037210 [Gymnothorax javanicus]|nr:hypothetical protein GJAV_G00037210 [Gymnothorax javanicus]
MASAGWQFHEMGLDDRLLKALADLGWAQPTLIQEKAIPLALDGKDLLARAKTGSGKTAAYAIPIIQRILASKQTVREQAVRALILVPTKELGQQVQDMLRQLTAYCARDVRVADISGKVDLSAHRPILMEKPDIVVGTPSRVLAHLNAQSLSLQASLEMLVIDEADLVSSFGYESDLKSLLCHLPKIYQAFLMSATLNEDVQALRELVLHNPVTLKLQGSQLPDSSQLQQYSIHCEEEDKFLLIYALLKLGLVRGKTLLFVSAVDRCYRLKLFLEQFSIPACVLNSELPVHSRCHIITQFNQGFYNYIIATDEQSLANPSARGDGNPGKSNRKRSAGKGARGKDKEYGVSRGIDFQNVSNVINFDLPASVDSYIHRVGRTARADSQGTALSFVSNTELPLLSKIEDELTGENADCALKPYSFKMEQIEGFRYRCRDAMRSVTKQAVKEARLKEIKQELLSSEKLKTYFEDNPRDLQLLRHDRDLHPAIIKPHLKNVPSYLIPTALKGFANPLTGRKKRCRPGKAPPAGVAKTNFKHQHKGRNPLKSFRYTRKKSGPSKLGKQNSTEPSGHELIEGPVIKKSGPLNSWGLRRTGKGNEADFERDLEVSKTKHSPISLRIFGEKTDVSLIQSYVRSRHLRKIVLDIKSLSIEMEPQSKQRVFTGVVTQLQENYGMVDQEVHFQTSDVIGRIPLLGEKVLVKAVWDPCVSLGWTAQRVQSLNSQPFKSPPPLLPSMAPNSKPGILGSKPQPLLKSPKIPPLIPSMQQNPPKPGLLQTPPHMQVLWGGQFEAWGGGGNRKRHGEGMGGRRAGRWEDGGWGGDGVHQKRRRWRGSLEEGQKKSGPPPPQNCPLFSRFPRDSLACDSLEMQRRYPHLPLPENFLHLQLSWVESFPPDRPLGLPGPCPFHLSPAHSASEAAPVPNPSTAYAVKVMLLSAPAVEELYRRCCGLSQDQQEPPGVAVHPTTLMKFLLAENGSELQLLGGRWCSQEDGPNPAKDPLVLIRTAVRCVREQTGLELGQCSQWCKMAEVRYLCGGEVETVVFFLPDVWRTIPSEQEWTELRAKARDEKEDGSPALPELPSLVAHPPPKASLSCVPLSSLLEPRNSQSQDAFEVGLSAELFSEMLQRDFGLQIYRSLCRLAPHGLPTRTEEREDSASSTGDEVKKVKDGKRRGRKERGSAETLKEEDKSREEGERNSVDNKDKESELVLEVVQSVESADGAAARDGDRPVGWTPVLPRRVLLSWVFFDRQLTSSLRSQDLQDILLSLGLQLTPLQARELVCRASVGELCQYRRLADRWEEPDPEDSDDSTLLGNRTLIHSGKGGGSSRRSGGSSSVDVVTHRGSVLNIPNLLRTLERGESVREGLEQRIAALQARLAVAESKAEALSAAREGQQDLGERLEKAELRNAAYEKGLKENAGHMIAVIEKMQQLVDKTTSLAESRMDGAEKA